MKKNILFSLLLLSLIASFSCSKQFTELAPENFLNAQEFYKTKDDFNSALIAAYARLQTHVSINFELEYRSDNLNIQAPTAGTQDRYDLNEFVETTANGIIQNAWRTYYNQIFRSNVIISNIENVSFEGKSIIEAEARFIRALTYFNVVRLWGDAPLVLAPLNPKATLEASRSSVSDIYEVIEQDLSFAVEQLPLTNEFGRATSGAAKGLLGKVYLTQGKYTLAIDELENVGSQYQLLNNVREVFDASNKQNAEILFSIRFDKDIEGEGHSLWLGVSDVSTADLSSKLIDAYAAEDQRSFLVNYQPNENLFAPGKFLDTESQSTRRYGNDYILLRYADILLMLAEAINEQGYAPNGSAFAHLNAVRGRAGLSPLSSSELATQEQFREAVLNERFLELPYEGHRWFDLIRTETAQQELRELGKSVQSHQLLLPIPQSEIEKVNNPNILWQNPGYNQ